MVKVHPEFLKLRLQKMTELDTSIRQLPGLLVNEAINIIFSFKKKKKELMKSVWPGGTQPVPDAYLGNHFLNFMDCNPTLCGSENAKLISIKRPGLMKTKP